MTVFIPTQHPLLEGPACPPKTKLVLLSAGGPARLSLKFGMHSCRQGTKGVGRIHITKLETLSPSPERPGSESESHFKNHKLA